MQSDKTFDYNDRVVVISGRIKNDSPGIIESITCDQSKTLYDVRLEDGELLECLDSTEILLSEERHTFDRFMDDIVEREERIDEAIKRGPRQSWGRTRDLKIRELPSNRIRWSR